MTNLLIRLIDSEYGILERFLYEALHVSPGCDPFEWNTIYKPEINVYIKDFGKKDDICFIAELDGQAVGAAWSRILAEPGERGFGNIDRHTPELAISVLPEYRGNGIGRKLLDTLHHELTQRRYDRISLSVQKTNPAIHLYERTGYRVIEKQETDYLMVKQIDKISHDVDKDTIIRRPDCIS